MWQAWSSWFVLVWCGWVVIAGTRNECCLFVVLLGVEVVNRILVVLYLCQVQVVYHSFWVFVKFTSVLLFLCHVGCVFDF